MNDPLRDDVKALADELKSHGEWNFGSRQILAGRLDKILAAEDARHAPAPDASRVNVWDRGKRPWTLAQWLQWANDNGATLTMNQMLDDWKASTTPDASRLEAVARELGKCQGWLGDASDKPTLELAARICALFEKGATP